MSFAPGLQTERRTLLLKFPELAELDKLRTDEQWLELATALRKWSVEVVAMEQGVQGVNKLVLNHNPAKNPKLEQAKSFLQMRLNMPAKQVESMSDAEVEVRYCVALYDDIADNWQKWFFLPYPQALRRFWEATRRVGSGGQAPRVVSAGVGADSIEQQLAVGPCPARSNSRAAASN